MAKAKIKDKALVGQDHQFYDWDIEKFGDIIFEVEEFNKHRKQLIAPKYGKPGEYGAGAVFVRNEDLIYIEEEIINNDHPYKNIETRFVAV